MKLVANNTWQIEVKFADEELPRFKFDVNGDWSYNLGDNDNNGYLDQTGADVQVTGNTTYTITVNDSNKSYTVVEATKGNKPPTAVAGDNLTILTGSTVTFDAFKSTDSDGEIVNYQWSNGLTGQQAELKYTQAGTYEVTLTVTDNQDATATDSITVTVIDNFAPEKKSRVRSCLLI